jgi:uncharacterized protein YaeQ
MALTATIYRLKLQLSDTDRNVYEALDLRLAQHPSETASYLVTRVLAYALCYQEGIAFTRGLAEVDEPAVWVKSLDDQLEAWIEVGAPSAERLHRASKACPRVVVFCHHDPELVLREARRSTIHRAEDIELYVPEPQLIAALAGTLERNMQWEVVHTGGQLYVTTHGKTHEGAVRRVSLTED